MSCQLSVLESKTKVKISDILSPSVTVGISTQFNINKFAQMAKENPESLPMIKLSNVSGKLYALNHHDVLLGCKSAGISEINAIIIDNCNGSADVVKNHFIETLENETISSTSIFDAIDFMEEKLQLSKTEILDILHIKGTPYEKIILSKSTNYISANSIEQLQNIVNHLSQRNLIPSQVCVPLYVISKISRLEEESHQLQLIAQIKGDLEGMSDGSFAWTTPEQIDSMIKYIRQDATHEENNREESTVANVTKTSDVGKPKEKDEKKKEKPTNNKETKTIKKSIPNMIIIPDEKTGKPSILVNKKTGAISRIEKSDHKDIIKTSSVGTKSLYSVPLDVTKHLQFDESQIKHKNFDSPKQLIDTLKMFPKDTKLSVFWNIVN
ncbi:hypothetical protein [Nitrosopumilus sp.]|uniref:hypothetical protein n=1 Tax=Nitrosopumilus sp. TaxID=2024843 RepID=UPI0029314E41|nr:hypothetical protein [Nitrosopumilus sp.]